MVRIHKLRFDFIKRGIDFEVGVVCVKWPCHLCKGMSSSSRGSNSGESDASYGELRLEFLSSSSESLHVEVEREVREDPPSEHAESLWPKRSGYSWVAEGVRNCSSKYRWSRLLKSWLNSIYLFGRGFDPDSMHVERVSAVECVCHGREGSAADFFYVYSCMFVKLHVRLPFDEFTIGVLRLLNVAPTQLHPNSWGSLQAFRLLCKALTLEPTADSFSYFYLTRPREPCSWVSLVGRPKSCVLDGFTQSFKNFKDGFFRVSMKAGVQPWYLDESGVARFPLYWTDSPTKWELVAKEALDAASRRVVDVLERLPPRAAGKWIVCCYLTDDPGRDVCGTFPCSRTGSRVGLI